MRNGCLQTIMFFFTLRDKTKFFMLTVKFLALGIEIAKQSVNDKPQLYPMSFALIQMQRCSMMNE